MRSTMRVARIVCVAVAVLGLALSAWAQTRAAGTFVLLPPGEQKIARALFEAQKKNGTATPLTLDEIAARKPGRGWGEVFKSMKAQGLLTDKSLGDVVSSYERRHPEVAKSDKAKPDKPDKPQRMDKPEKPEKPGR
jgi:hypothetical protein